MNVITRGLSLFLVSLIVWGCDSSDNPLPNSDNTAGTTQQQSDTTKNDTTITLTPYDTAETARYELTIINDWNAEAYPMNFPDDAHFSWLGGATHNSSVSFWKPGEVVSPGMQEMAETGVVEILVNQEVQAAMDQGTAFSKVYEKIYTPEKPQIAPGSRTTSLEMNRDYPLVTLATMLGASPDWFVGVSGLSLMENGVWLEEITVDLPLYDGGSREGWIPVMGGPEIIPPDPVKLITYEQGKGYGPATEPHIIGQFVFKRIE